MNNLIAGNWKLNPSSLAEAENLARNIIIPEEADSLEVVLLPPFVFLEELIKKFPNFKWGAQDFFFEDTGAYTGEVSLPMLKDVGASWVLVGHSERRKNFGETDALVNKKLLAALGEGFNVILAVGELKKEDGLSPVLDSLRKSTRGVREDHLDRLNVAYEPVWAISTNSGGESDTPEHAEGVIEELKKVLNVRYLYGGSVNTENAEGFLSRREINGALIGGASLRPGDFSKILDITTNN